MYHLQDQTGPENEITTNLVTIEYHILTTFAPCFVGLCGTAHRHQSEFWVKVDGFETR